MDRIWSTAVSDADDNILSHSQQIISHLVQLSLRHLQLLALLVPAALALLLLQLELLPLALQLQPLRLDTLTSDLTLQITKSEKEHYILY